MPRRRRSSGCGRRCASNAEATRLALRTTLQGTQKLAKAGHVVLFLQSGPAGAEQDEHGPSPRAGLALPRTGPPCGRRKAPGACRRAPGCDRVRRAALAGRGALGGDGMTLDSGNGGVLRRTEGRGRLYPSIIDTVGDTPVRADQPPRAGARLALRQVRVLQPGRLGEGPAGAQHHRGRRARRHAEARTDGGRGDQRQHRHRPRDGLRRQGLPAGGDHGRLVLDRAAAADALPRRQGRADPARVEGARHVHEGEGARRRSTAGSWRASSRPRPTPTSTRARRRRRSSPTSRASGSTISSPATAPAARSRASAGC